jgi:uncharacterized protein (TIGR00251 family)
MSRDAGVVARMLFAVNAARDADEAGSRPAAADGAGDGAADGAADGAGAGRSAPVALSALDQGRATALAVRAQPGARRSGVLGTWNAALKLGVGAPPEDGRANDGLVRLVAELFDLPRSAVSLVAGERSRNKTFRLEASPERVRRRLDELLEE